jgi:serine/threonine protein kinase
MIKQIENYSLQLELGQGAYSRVFKAVHNTTKEEVAIKMVKAEMFR